jgi:hypothetical protein
VQTDENSTDDFVSGVEPVESTAMDALQTSPWPRRALMAAACLTLLACATGRSADFPLWMRLLKWMSGDTSETPVNTTMMGPHLQISVRTELQPGDEAQAEAVLKGARAVMAQYRDVKAAERDGYKPFAPTGAIGEEVHYTHFWRAGAEKNGFDASRPGSLLYRRTAQGMQIVGVMYTHKPDAAPQELNRRVPLSIGIWHRHVHFCGWPSDAPKHEYDGPAPRFGYFGSIADQATCEAARGFWIPVALGWMTHVYPEGETLDDRWFGRKMIAIEAGLPEGYTCTSVPVGR